MIRFESITHLHLYASINTLIEYGDDLKEKNNIRVLDLGCGNGILLKTLFIEIKENYPDKNFEFFGLDVSDSLVQQVGYFKETTRLLRNIDNTIDWDNQLVLIRSDQQWPFENDFFDIIISNQVMEHVTDHLFTFKEIRRTLTQKGYSLHLYPLRYYLFEGHLFMPLVHKYDDYSKTYNAIKFWTRLGFGDYKNQLKLGNVLNLDDFSEKYADKMAFQVNYLYNKALFQIIKKAGLKGSFDFTNNFYIQKIRQILGLRPLEKYRKTEINSISNRMSTYFLRYINCITLVLRKKESNT